jgi:hypothetical protein
MRGFPSLYACLETLHPRIRLSGTQPARFAEQRQRKQADKPQATPPLLIHPIAHDGRFLHTLDRLPFILPASPA